MLDIKKTQEQTKTSELLELTEKLAQIRGELLIQQRILKDTIDALARKEAHKRLSEQEFFLRYSAINDERIRRLKKSAENW